MPFFLRFGTRDYPLPEGKFSIGRSETAQLCIEDPLASRNHAAISVVGDLIVLEDLGSRNGVLLNGERISSRQALKHGDTILIGSQQLGIFEKKAASRYDETFTGLAPTGISQFGVLGAVAEKALALGHAEEAERILGRQLEQVMEKARAGGVNQSVLEQSARYALRFAVLTKKAKWIDYLFRIHTPGPVLMDRDFVDELYSLCPKVPGVSRPLLREYLGALGAHAESYGPSERFVFGRLESLEKQL